MSVLSPIDSVLETAPTTDRRPRLLLVSYHFPPVGGAGVQRPVKFVKYLHRFGWDVSVLVAENPSVPVFDDSLCRDVPDDARIVKARTWEPGYRAKQEVAGAANGTAPSLRQRLKRRLFAIAKPIARGLLQPDPQILWRPQALKAATHLLNSEPHDAILATGPCYTNFLVGAALKRRFGLPLILDYRDEWDLSNTYLEHGARDRWGAWVQRRMQTRLLREADAIIATTQASTRRLEEKVEAAGGMARGTCVYNGFDADDRPSNDHGERSRSPNVKRIVYTGTLWNLTSVAPVVAAATALAKSRPDLIAKIEWSFIGRKTPEQATCLQELAAAGWQVECRDYCEHSVALREMADADALCLLLSDVPGAERVVPAKLFEYLAVGQEILAVLPPGEAADLLRPADKAVVVSPTDIAGLRSCLEQFAERQTPANASTATSDLVRSFSRERQTRQLADLLKQLTGVIPRERTTSGRDESEG